MNYNTCFINGRKKSSNAKFDNVKSYLPMCFFTISMITKEKMLMKSLCLRFYLIKWTKIFSYLLLWCFRFFRTIKR